MQNAAEGHNIIVVGASAGGVEAVSRIAAGLPPDFPAAIFVVVHIPPQATSVLPQIVGRAGPLPASHAVDGEPIRPGHIYIAPPDFHLLLERDRMRVVRGPRENRHRPAVDPMFRSAALYHGSRVIGVVLTGTLDDGTAGLAAVKQRGGIAVAQDPEDAVYPGMPSSAVERVDVDHVATLDDLPGLLLELARQPAPPCAAGEPPPTMEAETEIAEMDPSHMHASEHPGTPSAFACPECGGTLWEIDELDLIRFRCRVGHAFSADSLISAQADSIEAAFWVALRALEESGALAHRLAQRARRQGHTASARRFEEQEADVYHRAEVLRRFIVSGDAVDAAYNAAARDSGGE